MENKPVTKIALVRLYELKKLSKNIWLVYRIHTSYVNQGSIVSL